MIARFLNIIFTQAFVHGLNLRWIIYGYERTGFKTTFASRKPFVTSYKLILSPLVTQCNRNFFNPEIGEIDMPQKNIYIVRPKASGTYFVEKRLPNLLPNCLLRHGDTN